MDAGALLTIAFVGSGAGGIHTFVVDPDAGALLKKAVVDGGTNPSFLAFHPSKPLVYAVNEGSPGSVVAFELALATAALTRINHASSGGNGPAHVSVDRPGELVLAANYGSGTVAVLPIQPNGGVSAPTDVKTPGAKAHQVLTGPSNKWVFVPCLGADHVAQFALDPALGELTPNQVPTMPTANGAGPRHLDFHPSGKFAYLINELNSTLVAATFDDATGRLTPSVTVSTLPADFMGANTTAEVLVHPNGGFVYGSNRGHDSIVIFRIDGSSGALTLVGHQPTGGAHPRSFGFTPEGSLMLVANKQSDTITGFRVNAVTGTLTPLGVLASVPDPAFVGIRDYRIP